MNNVGTRRFVLLVREPEAPEPLVQWLVRAAVKSAYVVSFLKVVRPSREAALAQASALV